MKQFFGIGLMLVVLAHSNLGYSQSNRNHDDNGHGGFEYFIGIVGTPTPGKEEIDWSDQSLEELKDLGVNMLQLSVAFGWRPANEVLNMEDLNEEQIIMWKYRIKQAEKHGFKTIAHFGIPRWLNDNPVKPACILDQEIRDKYVHLISEFMTTFPEVNDILVYTYDQRAWLCSEFGPCPRCTGIPLSDRLPDFLNLLTETMQKARPGNKTMLWWKPWEISKGQTIDILNKIDPKGFGLMLNSSTSNEGYPFNDGSFKSDLGVKRFVQLAYELNIPVIGEFQHTFYKPLYMVDDYFPRLIYEQMNGWKEMEGVIGVKEYYGFAPSTFSVNYSMLKEWMKTPNASLEELLNRIAAPYGKKSAPCMIKAWEYVAQAVEAMPWDVPAGIGGPNSKVEHNWTPVKLGNASFDTPLWKANRKSYFMLTGDKIAHPWIIEDAGIRFKDASKLEFRAVEYFDKAIAEGERMVDNIQMQRDHIELTARLLKAQSLYFALTLAAQNARIVKDDHAQFEKVCTRIRTLLQEDVDNGFAEAVVKLDEFNQDPEKWLNQNFNPPPGWSFEAETDWSQWQTH